MRRPGALVLAACVALAPAQPAAGMPQRVGRPALRDPPVPPSPPVVEGALGTWWWLEPGVVSGAASSVEIGVRQQHWQATLSLTQEGASQGTASAPRAYPGGRLQASWMGGGGRFELDLSRGTPYGGFDAPLRLVDGRLTGPGAWVLQARAGLGSAAWRALYSPGLPLAWAHRRWIGGTAGALAVDVAPAILNRSGWVSALGLQAAWSEAGPEQLVFKSRPPLVYRRAARALAAHLAASGQPGWRLELASALYRWDQQDGDLQEVGLDHAWMARLRHTRRPRWALEAQWAGPGFDSPLSADPPLPRDRASLSLRGGPIGSGLHLGASELQLGGSAEWVASSSLQPLRREWELYGRLRDALPAGLRLEVRLERRAVNGRDVPGDVAVDLEADAWAVGATLRAEEPEVRLRVGSGRAVAVLARLRTRTGTGRVETRWAAGEAGGPSSYAFRAAYKWRPQAPSHYLFAEWAWELPDGLWVRAALGRWDGGRVEALFSDELRLGVMVGAGL